jgi:hypothetical protein
VLAANRQPNVSGKSHLMPLISLLLFSHDDGAQHGRHQHLPRSVHVGKLDEGIVLAREELGLVDRVLKAAGNGIKRTSIRGGHRGSVDGWQKGYMHHVM